MKCGVSAIIIMEDIWIDPVHVLLLNDTVFDRAIKEPLLCLLMEL